VSAEQETERLVRSWLQPAPLNFKAQIKLEVLEQEVMNVPVDIALGHWYHFCQSWSNTAGQWTLHANGKLIADGDSWKVNGLTHIAPRLCL
jgi:Pentaxin family.